MRGRPPGSVASVVEARRQGDLPVLDLRPLQEGHALRGIGRYVATLAGAAHFPEVIVWGDLPVPEVAAVVAAYGWDRIGEVAAAAALDLVAGLR